MRAILWLGGLSLLCLLVAGLVIPLAMRLNRKANLTVALSNLKQVSLCLFDFETDYGRFPDASTVPLVRAKTHTTLALGTSHSNDFFRQLIATGTKAEKIFFADISPRQFYPDDIIEGPKALEQDECSFTYIAGLSSSSDPSAPVAMTPVIPGTWKFDRKPFDGKAIVLFLDSSVRLLPIDKNGDVILNGMNLFDPRQLYWHGKAPDIKWPE